MSIDIRLLTATNDLAEAFATFRTAMVGLPAFGTVDDVVLSRIFEPGRTYGAFVDGKLVGTADSYSGQIAVPGGAWLPHAAVTHVGVLPTHTRRGLASALFKDQLRAARDRGAVVATLRASDARIYGRFGYGIASTTVSLEVDTERARLVGASPAGGPLRLLEAAEAWPVLAEIYAKQPFPRPGTITRSSYWWDFQAMRLAKSTAPAYVAVYGPEGAETGFVRYHPIGLDTWFTSQQRSVVVDDLIAHNAEAYRALISHLLTVDLPHRLVFPMRPIDDGLPWLFEDFRSVSVTSTRDETWLRLLDVGKALAARSYQGEASVILEVPDPILPENAIRLRLSRNGAEPTDLPADVIANVEAVSAAYLGGAKWWQLALAGRLEVKNHQAIASLDALFATEILPYAGTMF